MAIEATLVCDGCGSLIHAAKTARAARAEAQLQLGAFCGRDGDWCRQCQQDRLDAAKARIDATSGAASHSIGPRGKPAL